LPGLEEMTPDLFDPVLDEAAKLCEEILCPINRSGDKEGCVLENGVVRTPIGFQEAYRGGLDVDQLRPEMRRPGPAVPAQRPPRRDDLLVERVLRVLSRPVARRLDWRSAGTARDSRA
jgi:hypothetical protein